MTQKLPIGIQTLSKIREDDYLYIDKTQIAYDLINSYQYIFLARPRRFGKSLFLDTLKSIFEGRKELFNGLFIENKHNFDVPYPVIHISFSGELFNKDGIVQAFQDIIRYNQDRLGIECEPQQNPSSCFKTLITKAHKKYQQRVVILIDEYDKPLLDNITNKDMANYARDMLRGFYSVIKDNDQHIKFVFITGVSKFSKVSLFSGLNNLRDISLDARFGNICGYTQNDIETSFKPFLQGVDLAELKLWYNGYNFLQDKVYNPFDILLFCDEQHIYKNYWFSTGTPTFLIELIKKNNYYLPKLDDVQVGEEILDSFDIDNINLEVLLLQSGYLTIDKVIPNPLGGSLYSLTIPNKEIRLSLNGAILDLFLASPSERVTHQQSGFRALFAGKPDDFKQALEAMFASIPYENFTNNNLPAYEGFYASVIYIYLCSMGVPVSTEQSTNKGRLDMSILINNNRYIFEFKVGTENALAQIKANQYHHRYLNEGSNIYLVGINFDEQARNITEFKWEAVRSQESEDRGQRTEVRSQRSRTDT